MLFCLFEQDDDYTHWWMATHGKNTDSLSGHMAHIQDSRE